MPVNLHFEVGDAPGLEARVAAEVDLMAPDARRVRAVTHLDVERSQIERAVEAIAAAL